MQILVTMKQLGKKRNRFEAVPFVLDGVPETVRELIALAVQTCVSDFREKAAGTPRPLCAEETEARAELGKIAFGLLSPEELPDVQTAVDTAVQAYADGLVRILIGENECGAPDDPVTLHENDTVTFLRLTFLAGRLW